jgi:PAS domain S-box-containing protein
MIIEATASELRETGISVLGGVRWGTHFCCFYETKADLLETLVAYFKAGLQNNEFCVWVVSQVLTKEEARRALRQAVPELDRHLAEGRLEIHGHDEWYLGEERCDPQRVLQSWRDKLNLALTNGYAGLRASGDGGWVQENEWIVFREYEREVEGLIADRRRLLLCTYPLTTSSGDQVFDVACTHQMAVARRNGHWETIEPSELKQAKAEIKRLNEELEQKVEERTRELATTVEAVRRAEDRIRLVIDTIPTMAWTLRPDGVHDFLNQRWLDYTGLSLPEAIEEPTRTVHPEDLPRVLEKWLMVKETSEAYQDEMRLRRADGEYRWFLIRIAPLLDEQGNLLKRYGVAIDIEDRKQAEEKLKQSESQLAEAQRLAHVGSWSLDLRSNTVTWSDELYRMFGVGPSEFDHRYEAVIETTHPEDRDLLRSIIENAVKTREPFSAYYRMTRADGEVRVLHAHGAVVTDESGNVRTMHGAAQDVTERKEAEERLRRSEEKFKALFDLAPVGIAVLDQQRNVLDANPALAQIMRLAKEELLSSRDLRRTILNADGRPVPPHEFPSARALREHRPISNIETGMVMENGETVWLQVSVAPLDLPDASAVVITQDITERKRAAEKLEKANRQLRILSRQLFHIQEEERRHLARELHDEIGQTLTAAKINLKIIAPDVPAEIIGRLDDSVQLLDRLLKQVRELSLNLRPPLLDELGLVPTLRWLVDQQAQRAGLRVNFTANVDGLEIDPDVRTTCFRVAQEAITNIVRHSGAKNVTVELRREVERLTLEVRDDGAGFDPALIQQRTTQDYTLGLVSMKERALLVRGGFEVHSAPGQGTEIRAWFPLPNGEELSTAETA